jgi:mannose-6-phosphate isomerase-like protein (cupin superfamily)
MSASNWIFTHSGVSAGLPDDPSAVRVHYALRHGTMKLGLYAPRGADMQGPHKQDELYIVASGSGTFFKNGDRVPFNAQDVIFVEAGAEHRFEAFTPDFSAWVVFWGPEGGEA